MLVVASQNAFLAGSDGPVPATLEVDRKTGKILAVREGVAPRSLFPQEAEYLDLSDLWLLPGALDCHVHLNEPGRTEWEGFATGTAVRTLLLLLKGSDAHGCAFNRQLLLEGSPP